MTTLQEIGALVLLTGAAFAMTACAGDRGPPGAEGASGPTGATGPSGPTGPSAISAVSPLTVFLTRSATVTISGSNTQWTPSAIVDFGAGIRVIRTTVASPAALIAVVHVDNAATTGVRSIVVHDGTSTQTFQGAFEVIAPSALEVMGTAMQGSLLVIRATNQDLENPFDGTSQTDADGYATFPNFRVDQPAMTDGGSGVAYSVYNVAPRFAEIVATIDVGAPTGPQVVTLENGPVGARVEVPSEAGYSIGPRAARALLDGEPATGMLRNAYDSDLYAFDSPAGLNVVDLAIEATGPAAANANLQLIRLPRSGRFADLIEVASTSLYTTAGREDSGYVIAWDNSGSAGYPYTISAFVTPAVGISQSSVLPTSAATAQVIAFRSAPVIIQQATLDSASDARYFAVEIGTGDLGRSLRIFTEAGPGGDSATDVAIDLRDALDTSILATGPVDEAFFEDVVSDPLTVAGTYYVVITAGSGYEDSATRFQAMLRLE